MPNILSRPAVFHVTHAKAGSTWINHILRDSFDEPVFPRFGGRVESYEWEPGTVYPAIFLDYETFQTLERAEDSIVFYVIRDIRDTLVSLYFSLRYTHTEVGNPQVTEFRKMVAGMDDREGLLHVFRTRSDRLVKMQKSWLNSRVPILKYEEMIATGGGVFPGFLERLGVAVDRDRMETAIQRHDFKNAFGRNLGERDDRSHGRQGLPGDWKNFLSDEITGLIENELCEVLQLAGYQDTGETGGQSDSN
jgi:hypothetical protein